MNCFNRLIKKRPLLLWSFVKVQATENCYFATDRPSGAVSTNTSHEALARSGYLHAEAKSKKISKAMESFLKMMAEKEKFFIKENADYELGKRHLANMMNLDPDTMTEADINKAIEYLLPSGLFSPRARPQMTKPEKLYPPVAPPQFAMSGRPFDDMFYTLKPALYQTLYEIHERIEKVIKYEERETIRGNQPQETLSIPDGVWRHFLPGKVHVGNVSLAESDLKKVEAAMEYLLSLPYSYMEKDFILTMRIPAESQVKVEEKIEPKIVEENGRRYCLTEALRRACTAYVKVYEKGTGKITVNGRDLYHFRTQQARQLILSPLLLLNRLENFDIEATTETEGEYVYTPGAGEASKAGAIRLGIALGMRPFISEDEITKLTLAGLLSRDPRNKERNKPAKLGARARRQWLKR